MVGCVSIDEGEWDRVQTAGRPWGDSVVWVALEGDQPEREAVPHETCPTVESYSAADRVDTLTCLTVSAACVWARWELIIGIEMPSGECRVLPVTTEFRATDEGSVTDHLAQEFSSTVACLRAMADASACSFRVFETRFEGARMSSIT